MMIKFQKIALTIFLISTSFSLTAQISLKTITMPMSGNKIIAGEFGEEVKIKLEGYSYKDVNVYIDSAQRFLWIYRGSTCWKNTSIDVVRLYGEKIKYKRFKKLKGGDMNLERVHISDRNDLYFTGLNGKKMSYLSGNYMGETYSENYVRSSNVKVSKSQITDAVIAGSGEVINTDKLIVKVKKDDKGKHWLSIKKKVLFECVSGDCVSGDGKMVASNLMYKGSFSDGKPSGNGQLIYYKSLVENKDVFLKYEGEFNGGQITGNGKISLYLSEYTNYPIYTGAVKDGFPEGNGTFKMPTYDSKVSKAFTEMWTENYTKFFKGLNPNISDVVLEEFTGSFLQGYPNGAGNFKISCKVLGNITEFAGNVTFMNGEIQKPYSLEALEVSGSKSYTVLGKTFNGNARFTLKDGNIAAPIKLKTYYGEVLINDFAVKKEGDKSTIQINEISGFIDYGLNVNAVIGANGYPVGEYGYVKDEIGYYAKNYTEKGTCSGAEIKDGEYEYYGDVYCENFIIKVQGKGKKTYNSGSVYEGDFVDGVISSGKCNFSNGNSYEGQFNSSGQKHGKGKFIWKSGDKYDGDYVNNERHGTGTYNWPNGDSYVGQWQYGNRTGKGKFVWKNGEYYDGNWANSKKTGSGYASWSVTEGYYEGETYDGRNKGNGTFTFKNGDKYTGEVDGLPNGQGTMKYANGSVKTGRFINGVFSPYGPCSCEFDSYDHTDTKEWYNVTLYMTGGATKKFKLYWSESESENRIMEYFDFTVDGKKYYYRWVETDVSDPTVLGVSVPNTEGALRRNYKTDQKKIGKTTDESYMMKLILREIFSQNCSSIKHDY